MRYLRWLLLLSTLCVAISLVMGGYFSSYTRLKFMPTDPTYVVVVCRAGSAGCSPDRNETGLDSNAAVAAILKDSGQDSLHNLERFAFSVPSADIESFLNVKWCNAGDTSPDSIQVSLISSRNETISFSPLSNANFLSEISGRLYFDGIQYDTALAPCDLLDMFRLNGALNRWGLSAGKAF
jgi:hypothetical protein